MKKKRAVAPDDSFMAWRRFVADPNSPESILAIQQAAEKAHTSFEQARKMINVVLRKGKR